MSEDNAQNTEQDSTTAAYDVAPYGVCIIDTRMPFALIAYANDAFLKMFGMEGKSARGKVLTDLWPSVHNERISEALDLGENIAEMELPLGETGGIWGRLTLTHTVYDSHPAAVIWVADISAVKRAEAEAKAMMEMKSSFLATMSHEIRTPMQSVYGLLELVADEKLTDNARDMVATARKSASGLLEILDDILDLAKVEAGKIELDHFEVPLRTLAYGVLECLEVRLMGKPVKLVADIEKDLPFVVMGDPTRLRQILINLVGNSIKFTEKGNVTLRVSKNIQAIAAPATGLALRFEIEDTGIGMPPHVAAKLFKAFTQADNSTTRKYGGTGLGLSISQKLIELMGGKIGVDSVEGKGSTFWFEIPTEPADEQAKVDLPHLEGIAVLSVEDHPKGAKEILSSLTSMGAKVESVPTYKEGLELIKKRPFDVLVADQGLPDGLGIDLLKEAAKLRPYMGLILYTVRNDFGMQYTTKVIGAKYLAKPASRLGLGEAVKGAAKQMAAQDYTGPRKLLIAEDTDAVQDVLRRQLDKLGVEADFVRTGIEALRELEKKEHGILFTDLHMPDMDGYQLVASIRADEEKNNVDSLKRFPVIALTADVQLAQRQAYLSYGFDECLLKPVSLGQFRQLLIRWGVMKETDADKGASVHTEKTEPAAVQTLPVTKTVANSGLPPALDKNMIIQQLGALDDQAVEMLGMFVQMTKPLVEKFEPAFHQGNMAQLKELAHSLKGAARSAGCAHLGDLAGEIQDRVSFGRPITPEMIGAVCREFTRAETEIRQMKAG